MKNSGFVDVSGLAPSPDGKYLYLSLIAESGGSKSGIYQMDLNTGLIMMINRSCSSKGYGSLSCSSDGKKLLVTREDTEMEFNNFGVFTGTFFTNKTISIIDLCSLEETRLNLN